jgi:hypothetical protein
MALVVFSMPTSAASTPDEISLNALYLERASSNLLLSRNS